MLPCSECAGDVAQSLLLDKDASVSGDEVVCRVSSSAEGRGVITPGPTDTLCGDSPGVPPKQYVEDSVNEPPGGTAGVCGV